VFSVILSNKPGIDLFGNDSDTILLRNGVTGTAANKTAGDKIIWFYHGRLLNDGNLSVCITQDQFTMSYQADGHLPCLATLRSQTRQGANRRR